MNSINSYINAKYKELVTDPASTNYWLSSRCVFPSQEHCDFGIQIVRSNCIDASGLDYRQGDYYFDGVSAFKLNKATGKN